MFDRNNTQAQPMGDVSSISLPGSSVPPQAQQTDPYQLPDHQISDHASQPQQDTTSPQTSSTDILAIKQQALAQLSPLVSHLEQTPEEKFRTTMMMIQASDDDSLIPVAYEAANGIEDEKSKAQALLDVINEINYFSQKHQS